MTDTSHVLNCKALIEMDWLCWIGRMQLEARRPPRSSISWFVLDDLLRSYGVHAIASIINILLGEC